MPIPLFVVAFALAVLAPLVARGVVHDLERRSRERTRRALDALQRVTRD